MYNAGFAPRRLYLYLYLQSTSSSATQTYLHVCFLMKILIEY